jgi:uncharacterized protein YuzE
MKLIYDPEQDRLTIVLSSAKASRSENGHKGLLVHFDDSGAPVKFEISDASSRIDDPKSVDLSVAGVNVRGMRMF